MNISLRKANAIQNSISETLKSIRLAYIVELNEFENPEAIIKNANDELFNNDSRRHALLLAFYNIRGLVGVANAHSGINENLAMAAFIDKRISQLDDLANSKPHFSLEVINGKLDKIRNRKDDSRSIYGRDESVSTSVVSQEQIDQARTEIKKLKKQKQKLNDEILELNIKTEIPLSDDIVNTLQKEGII